MSIEVLITALIGFITSLVSGWTSWFFTRKKYNSEVDSTIISNMKESLDFYRQLSDDNKQRLEEVLKRNDELEARDKRLEEEVRELRKQVFNMMNSICLDLSCQLRKNQLYGDKNERNKVGSYYIIMFKIKIK